jgi:hypothetical protein
MGYILNQYGALLVYVNPRPSKRKPSGGYTFRWDRPRWAGNSGERLESTVRKFELVKEHGTRVECSLFEEIKLVSSDVGLFFSNAISAGRTLTS